MKENKDYLWVLIRIVFPWGILALIGFSVWYYSTHPDSASPPQYDAEGRQIDDRLGVGHPLWND